jgi:hypothetical protein
LKLIIIEAPAELNFSSSLGLERLFIQLTKVNFFPLEEEKKLAATAATNKRRHLFLLSSSTSWFMIKKIMRNEDHKKNERKSRDFLIEKISRFTAVYDKT